MLAYTYLKTGEFRLLEKPKPVITAPRDAIVRVTLASVCTSDLHIKHGSVPRAVPGITVGHEMVGIVEETGSAITALKKGDRVAVNVETFCGSCYFCRKGFDRLAYTCARPNAVVVIVALYDEPQTLPLPSMYGKNLTFKTGGVDGCDCDEILRLIKEGKIDTTPLITHRMPLKDIEKAYDIFANRKEHVIKIALENGRHQ